MTQYTVKQVVALTGVPAATLRAWERRYGVVAPARTPSGYRLYDDDDVRRLSLMSELIASGTPASLAANQAASAPADAANATPRPPIEPPTASEAALAAAGIVQAGQALDADLLDALLAEAFAHGSFELVAEHWVMPALRAVGDAWEAGELDVAGEHFVSAAVHRRLALWFEAARVRPGSPTALVGLPPGALHELGSLAFATCLRRQGVDVRYLGANVPHESWLQGAETLRPGAMVVGIPTRHDVPSAARTVEALTAWGRAFGGRVFVGGGGSPALVTAHPDVTHLGSLAEAARHVADALRS